MEASDSRSTEGVGLKEHQGLRQTVVGVCGGLAAARIIWEKMRRRSCVWHRSWQRLPRQMDSTQQRSAFSANKSCTTVARWSCAMGVCFLLLVVLLQFLRADLDWVDAQLSAYLHGPYGALLRSAYCLLAVSMAMLAGAGYRSLLPRARSFVVLVLFQVSAVGLAMVAIGDTFLPTLAPAIAPAIHLLSAHAAFLCVIAAVMLQSWYFRYDPRWRTLQPRLFLLACAGFVALAVHVGITSTPRGLTQKLAIVLIDVWLVRVAWHLLRLGVAGSAAKLHSGENAGVIQTEEA